MSDAWDEELPTAGEAAERPPDAVELAYREVESRVTEWLSPLLRRRTNVKTSGAELAWCPRWWAHAEAIDRLESMWRAWEAARGSPTIRRRWRIGGSPSPTRCWRCC